MQVYIISYGYLERNEAGIAEQSIVKSILSGFQVFDSIGGDRGPPLWSSGQSFWLQIQRSRVRFPALPDFLSSSGSGTGSTQPREIN